MYSTKPEVHNSSHCHQGTEPWPQVQMENMVKFKRVVFETCEQTDKQADIQTR